MITKKSRELRKNMTPQERKLWTIIRKRTIDNLKFRRQYPIGKYIVDFYCASAKLAVELDGGGHYSPEEQKKDQHRTE